ncbi:hypothetical protein [Dyella sp. SG609]|uniref:hypothetical protein n=1 Tax=Dyella sp. SG609 TaxID=2587018 RepID=UPI001444A747|nr:hypothetical protein [Dyella sp. SG609]NKJ21993.1 hypothetical protein [Dyella sp. SG609]
MAKTLKTGDVKRIVNDPGLIYVDDKWVTIGGQLTPMGYLRREDARWVHSTALGTRIAKIIKRGPKFLFVQISK